jgi:hypothetical protein
MIVKRTNFVLLLIRNSNSNDRTMIQDTNTTQLSKAKASLAAMLPSITAEDRAEAIKELGTTKETLSRYLTGNARSVDTSIRFIKFFKKRIEDREKVLS